MDNKFTNDFNVLKFVPALGFYVLHNEVSLVVKNTNLLFTLNFLKNHINFRYVLLSCISGIDTFSLKYRFGVIYDILSLQYNTRLKVKVFINEITSVYSVVPIYTNANWWERETWDMYGIYFFNHPDLRRILTDYGFDGYPLRKDFPLTGYVEVRYDTIKKRVVLESIELPQEFRSYTYETPW